MVDPSGKKYGPLILIGSGETSPYGKTLLRKVFQLNNRRYKVTILETPAGFQPNSALVAQEIKNIFLLSLPEFTDNISVIPARRRGTVFSPDDESLLRPLLPSDFIFFGPGSPTYTVRQLKESLALKMITERWSQGATLCLSSAAVLAAGSETLPVYEIYKAGADLYWERGLGLPDSTGFKITFIPHWNNGDGGKNLDTRYCFMGGERFSRLKELLPAERTILGIEENSAAIFDFNQRTLRVIGKGQGILQKAGGGEGLILENKIVYNFTALSYYFHK